MIKMVVSAKGQIQFQEFDGENFLKYVPNKKHLILQSIPPGGMRTAGVDDRGPGGGLAIVSKVTP